MNRFLLIVFCTFLLSACSSEKKMNPSFVGHWVNEDFYNHISKHNSLAEFNGEKLEFVIPENDTNYTLINFKGKILSGPLELMKDDHLVIKNFYGNYKNADIVYSNNTISFINNETSEKTTFIKINSSDLNSEEANSLSTYCLPYINKNYIAGNYIMNTDTIQFSVVGNIKNLGDFQNYTFCLNESCRNNNNRNTIFLSNKKNEGNYYEYEFKNDSLYIFEIDIDAFNRGLKAGNVGMKYKLKKIN